MSPSLLLVIYCVVAVLASVGGGLVPLAVRLTHRRMQLLSSGVAGFMLGVAVLVLLPHALMVMSVAEAMPWLLGGLLTMFFLERVFCYHHHDVPLGVAVGPGEEDVLAHLAAERDARDTDHHDHGHEEGGHRGGSAHALRWGGAAVGLTLHSLIDGVALAAAVAAEPVLGHDLALPGLAVFLVVALHRPLDALTLLTLTASGGHRRVTRHAINFAFSLVVPLGAVLFVTLSGWGVAASPMGWESATAVGAALAFSTGVFLCVSLSDLLPELQFHTHDRVSLSAALLLGLALAWGVHRLESSVHQHEGHGHPGSHEDHEEREGHEEDDAHEGHDH